MLRPIALLGLPGTAVYAGGILLLDGPSSLIGESAKSSCAIGLIVIVDAADKGTF